MLRQRLRKPSPPELTKTESSELTKTKSSALPKHLYSVVPSVPSFFNKFLESWLVAVLKTSAYYSSLDRLPRPPITLERLA